MNAGFEPELRMMYMYSMKIHYQTQHSCRASSFLETDRLQLIRDICETAPGQDKSVAGLDKTELGTPLIRERTEAIHHRISPFQTRILRRNIPV